MCNRAGGSWSTLLDRTVLCCQRLNGSTHFNVSGTVQICGNRLSGQELHHGHMLVADGIINGCGSIDVPDDWTCGMLKNQAGNNVKVAVGSSSVQCSPLCTCMEWGQYS
jgi:hypothetical protein